MAGLFIPRENRLPCVQRVKRRVISRPAQAVTLADDLTVGLVTGAGTGYRASVDRGGPCPEAIWEMSEDRNIADPIVAAAVKFRSEGLSLMDDPVGVYRFRDQARGHLLALLTALGDVDPKAVAAVEADGE